MLKNYSRPLIGIGS